MNDLARKIEENKGGIMICLAALMFIFFAFCPAVDVLGKAKANGFELMSSIKDLGFSSVVATLMLIVPIVEIVGQFTALKLRPNFDTICFLAAFVLAFLLSVSLPSGVSFAWGSWLYMIIAIAGLAVCNIQRFAKN